MRLRPRSNRSRSPNLVLGVLALALSIGVGCTKRQSGVTATSLPEERQAPGVIVDPVFRLPPTSPEQTTDQNVMVLRAPVDSSRALELVQDFFQAVVEESFTDLEATLSDKAWVTLGRNSDRHSAHNSWRARLLRLDYKALGHQVVFRLGEIETYRRVEGNHPSSPLPLTVTGDDLLLRVPIVTPRTGSVRLFGDEVWFLLKPDSNGYKIAELVENFQVP